MNQAQSPLPAAQPAPAAGASLPGTPTPGSAGLLLAEAEPGSLHALMAERVKKGGFGHCRIEGLPAADWVLIDAGDIIVHLFRPEVRAFYNLERMWTFNSDAPAVA